jgi:hypothetical protein
MLLALAALACSVSSSALLCDAGHYSSTIRDAFGVDQPACKPCQPGHHAAVAGRRTSCAMCSQGYFSVAGQTQCTACPEGTFAHGLATQHQCNPCAPGTHSPWPNATYCPSCPYGRFQPASGSDSCIECDANMHGSNEPRGTVAHCVPCEAGRWRTLGMDPADCAGCAVGKFRAAGSAPLCSDCAAGRFAKYPGQGSCASCAKGRFFSAEGGSTCCEHEDCAGAKSGSNACCACGAACAAPISTERPLPPATADYVSSYWAHGPPAASCDDRYWGWSRQPNVNLAPAGTDLVMRGAATCNGYTGCGTGTSLARWQISIRATAEAVAGTSGADLAIMGDNGKSFPISSVGHFAWKGANLFVHPVGSNAQYSASLLTDFNALFPPGTTLKVVQSCTNGFNSGGACAALPAQLHDGLALETGYYDASFDAKSFKLRHFAPRSVSERAPRTASALAAHVAAVDAAAPSPPALNLTVSLDGVEYRCAGLANYVTDYGNEFPVRIVKDGRVQTHVDVLNLAFTAVVSGASAPSVLTGYFEVIAWPRCVSFAATVSVVGGAGGGYGATLSVRPGAAAAGNAGGAHVASASAPPGSLTPLGVTTTFCANAATGELEPLLDHGDAAAPLAAELTSVHGAVSHATFNRTRSSYALQLPAVARKSFPAQLDSVDRYALKLHNPNSRAQELRLDIQRTPQSNVVGLVPMLLLPDGRPSGIPVQLSKNWHNLGAGKRTVHDGTWLSVSTVVMLPPNSAIDLQLVLSFAHWGGVPAASHAQLSLIGWGGNGLWHEAAIGSFGEQICYDPARQRRGSTITDTRPLQVCTMGDTDRCKEYGWTSNVGGGDSMLYYDGAGVHQYAKQTRAVLRSPGPCLTNVTYTEVSADGALATTLTVSLARTPSYTKATHALSVRVLKDTEASRLVLYALGAEGYNYNTFAGAVLGNGSAAATFVPGGLLGGGATGYVAGHERRACGGGGGGGGGAYVRGSCWAFLPKAVAAKVTDSSGGADRGLVLREWRAVLGGAAVGPHLSWFKKDATHASLELSLPPGLRALKVGDFVEAQVESLVLPSSAAEYYGADKSLKRALEAADARATAAIAEAQPAPAGESPRLRSHWQLVASEAVDNSAAVVVSEGSLEHAHPVRVRVDADSQQAAFVVAGGLGHVPVTVSGLSELKPFDLFHRRSEAEPWMFFDQSTNQDANATGSDYWQSDYDAATRAYAVTYNVPMDPLVSMQFRFHFRHLGVPTPPPAPGWNQKWAPCTHIHCRIEKHTCTHYHLFNAIDVNQGYGPFTDGYNPSCAESTSIRVTHHKQERSGRKHHCYMQARPGGGAPDCVCQCGEASEEDPLIVLGDEASGLTAASDSYCPAAGHTGTHHCTGNRIHGSPAEADLDWPACRQACSSLGASCLAHTLSTCDCFDSGDEVSSLRMMVRSRSRAVRRANHLLADNDPASRMAEWLEAPGGQPGVTTAYCPVDTSRINGTMALMWYKMAAGMGSQYAAQRVHDVRHALAFHAHLFHGMQPSAKCELDDPNAVSVPITRESRDAGRCECRQGYWKVTAGVVVMDRCFPCPDHSSAKHDVAGFWTCGCSPGYELQQSVAAAGGLACVARDNVDGYRRR